MYQLAKYLFLIGFADRKQGHDSYQQAQEQASDKEQQEQAAGSCQACQCIRGQPFGSGCCDEEPEKNGLQRVGYQYDGNHSQMEMREMDCNAGWRAKTNVPIPITVVKAEKKMAVCASSATAVLCGTYSAIRP